MQEAHLALETDPDLADVRLFLAEAHEQFGETRKAVHQYEALHFMNTGDDQYLNKIKILDPTTAARLTRLAQLAPDPFVGGARTAASDDAFQDDDDDMIDASPGGAGAPGVGAVTMTPQGAGEYVDDDDELLDSRPPAGVRPEQYEFEDEPKYREAASAVPAVAMLLDRQRSIWDEEGQIDELLARATPLSPSTIPHAYRALEQSAALLGTPITTIHVMDGEMLRPLVCGSRGAYMILPSGVVEALTPEELKFLIGRTLSRIACDHIPLLDVIAGVLPRSSPPTGLQVTQAYAASHSVGGPESLGEGDAARQAMKALHTWRLRAELTADRAGLIACKNLRAAATAIAKLTAPDVEAAATASIDSLKQRFAGQDLGKVAAIAVDSDPETSEPYAFYRISMLVWWSKQPAYEQLKAVVV